MPVTYPQVLECEDSDRGDLTNYEKRYLISLDPAGTCDQNAASAALLGTAPSTLLLGGYTLERQIDNIRVDSLKTRPDLWMGTVRYARPSYSGFKTGDYDFQFDTAGGSAHITQSLETVSHAVADDWTFVDFSGAIGVGADGQAAGCDVPEPKFSFSKTQYRTSLTDTDISNLYALTGKVNNAGIDVAFDPDNPTRVLHFDGGELLLQGVGGDRRKNEGDWELTFRGEAKPNRTGVTIGDITVSSVSGWDYLWITYSPMVFGGQVVVKPVQANVERVLFRGDFSVLGM